jgi:hypothetical protein
LISLGLFNLGGLGADGVGVTRFRWAAAGAAVVIAVIATMQSGADVASPHSVYAFGAPFHGSTGLAALNQPIVSQAALPDGSGYWTVTKDGQVSPFGAAPWLGDTEVDPSHPVIGIAATPSGDGYWIATSDGDLHVFGDASFNGSLAGVVGQRDVVGIGANPAGGGYWLVTKQGAVYSYGSSAYHGSLENVVLNGPIVGLAPTASGKGYWLVGRDGGVFAFGDAVFHGSLGATPLPRAVVGMARASGGAGYWLASSDGGVFTFGDADFFGSLGASSLPQPTVAITAAPAGGYWLTTTGHLAPPTSPRAEPDYLFDGQNAISTDIYADGRPTTYRQLNPTAGCLYGVKDGNPGYRYQAGGSGRNVVRLRTTDETFVSVGCGTWSSDLFPATALLDSTVGDGGWLLGIDIRSGTWRAAGGAGCTWRSVADLSGLPSGILSSGGGTGPQMVKLSGSEAALVSTGCGTWTPD